MLKRVFFQVFISFLFIFLISNWAISQAENAGSDGAFGRSQKSTLEVTGKGEVKIKPDVAYLTLAVETTSKTASEAVKNNAEKMKSVLDKLKSQIGKGDKITTTGYQLSPIYEYDEKTRKSVLTGYRVSNQVVVETENLGELGKFIDSVTQVGANRVDSLSLGTNKKADYRREALVKAVQDARETAEIVANAGGVKIVRILRISPSYEVPIPVYREFAVAKSAPAEAILTPIEPGELTVNATVSIVFEIQ